jgi:hypothetical protein
MKLLEEAAPVINPVLYTVPLSNGQEFVFVGIENGQKQNANFSPMINKTRCEGLENHFHLFDRVFFWQRKKAINVGTKIAENLRNSLDTAFPKTKFKCLKIFVILKLREKGYMKHRDIFSISSTTNFICLNTLIFLLKKQYLI